MTMNLYWRPVAPDAGLDLSDKLKFALRKRFGSPIDVQMYGRHKFYLDGLLDAGIEDAQTLLDAIDQHGEVKVYEE